MTAVSPPAKRCLVGQRGFSYIPTTSLVIVVISLWIPSTFARRPTGSDGWWPREIRRTIVDFSNEDAIWWPPAIHDFRPTGRFTVVKEDWAKPQPDPGFVGKTMLPVSGLLDYWNGVNFNIAYGHVMNSFECVRPDSPTFDTIGKRLIDMIPIRPVEGQSAVVARLNRLPVKHTIDNGMSQLEIELGQQRSRQHPRGRFVRWPALIGMTFYAEIHLNVSGEHAAALFRDEAGAPSKVIVGEVEVIAWITATYSSDKKLSLFEYRVTRGSPTSGQPTAVSAADAELPASEHPGLSVMTFNVWNTNPPNWLLNGGKRFERYSQRMDLLCSIVSRERPAIIGFQEVRYDSTLGSPDEHCQMEHIAKRLPEYYYSFTPAMSYYKANEMRRVDEGPAIASIFPIIRSDYVLLSRDINDNRDEHQRLCLHVLVDVPKWGPVDVYSVHLSLLEEARDNSVVELWDVISNKTVSTGVTQILMGDMNAEPQESAMEFLLGKKEKQGRKTDFIDAWLALHPEPVPRSNETFEQRDMLTFPSDAPSKRIDFILVRGKGSSEVQKTWLVGQDPLPGVGRDPEIDEDGNKEDHLGMVHKDSKLWASDHRGLVTILGGPD